MGDIVLTLFSVAFVVVIGYYLFLYVFKPLCKFFYYLFKPLFRLSVAGLSFFKNWMYKKEITPLDMIITFTILTIISDITIQIKIIKRDMQHSLWTTEYNQRDMQRTQRDIEENQRDMQRTQRDIEENQKDMKQNQRDMEHLLNEIRYR